MSSERATAVEAFFESDRKVPESAEKALDEIEVALSDLVDRLTKGSALGDQHGTAAREEADLAIHNAGLALGRAAVAGLGALVESGDVQGVAPRRSTMEAEAAPLDPSWQQTDDPYAALAEEAEAQRERLSSLRERPAQAYRRIYDAVALAADAAAWTAWAAIT